MKLAIATCCYRDRPTDEIEETIVQAGKHGIPYVELGGPLTYKLSMIQWLDTERMLQSAKDNGVEIIGLYGPGIANTSEEDALQSVIHMQRTINAAQALRVPVVVCTAPRRTEGGLQHVIAGLKRLVGDLERTGVRLCLENHYKHQFMTHEDYEELIHEFAGTPIGITLDTGHFHSAQVDMIKFIDTFGPQIWHVHLKDHIGTQSVPIGSGEIPLADILGKLRDVGYQGYISMEFEVADPEQSDDYVVASQRYLNGLLEAEAAR